MPDRSRESPPPRYATDPAFRAAQHVAALREGWEQVDAPPEGEVLWRDGNDTVRLTPTRWLVYVIPG